jgi:hypothetical protein
MKNDIQSNNSKIGSISKHFLLPSGPQLLLYALISILLLIAFNIKRVWEYLNDVVLLPQGGLDSLIAEHLPWLHKFLSSLSQSIILQVVFWLAIGCGIYIIIWFVKNIFINVKNDMVADNYVHPAYYKRSTYWESLAARKVFFWVVWFLLAAQIVSGLRLITYLANLCYMEVLDFHLVHSLFTMFQSVLAGTGLVYVIVLLIHLAVNSWHLIYKDL